MRGAISKSAGNSSLAEESRRYGCLNGHEGESRIQPRRTCSYCLLYFGGQGVHREVGSEGHEERYRAVVDGETRDEPVGQRWGKVESAVLGTKALSLTHRTKVFAGGTVRKRVTSRTCP